MTISGDYRRVVESFNVQQWDTMKIARDAALDVGDHALASGWEWLLLRKRWPHAISLEIDQTRNEYVYGVVRYKWKFFQSNHAEHFRHYILPIQLIGGELIDSETGAARTTQDAWREYWNRHHEARRLNRSLPRRRREGKKYMTDGEYNLVSDALHLAASAVGNYLKDHGPLSLGDDCKPVKRYEFHEGD